MLTVREENSVRDAVKQAMAENPFADDMMAAAVWRISKEPTCGRPMPTKTSTIPQRRLLRFRSTTTGELPEMLVRYYILENVAVVDWVRFLPFNPDQAVNPDAFTV